MKLSFRSDFSSMMSTQDSALLDENMEFFTKRMLARTSVYIYLVSKNWKRFLFNHDEVKPKLGFISLVKCHFEGCKRFLTLIAHLYRLLSLIFAIYSLYLLYFQTK